MKRYIVGDFETASFCDLKASGAWRYAEDPTTEVLCFNWWDHGAYLCWHPTATDGSRGSLMALANHPEVLFIAHNAAFEKAIWRNIMIPTFGFPDIPDERWHDTMAVCGMKNIALKLEKAVETLKLDVRKDMKGSAFTIGLSKPNKKTGMLDRSEESLQRVYRYCYTDVKAELILHKRLGWLQPMEQDVWLLDQKINQRGVAVDLDFIRAAQSIVQQTIEPMAKEFKRITGFNHTQREKVLMWCIEQGAYVPDMKKETIADLLGHDETGEDQGDQDIRDIPQNVREAMSIRQVIGSASIKKLTAMDACVGSDGRVRGSMQYHAAGTGRWGGRLIQPQNFPKPTLKDVGPDELVSAILSGDPAHVEATFGVDAIAAVVSALRHAIVAREGSLLAVGDFAAIEARVVLALAGQWDKVALLASGAEVYCDAAEGVFHEPIVKTDPRRQIGKGIVLGCGFQMGWRKFKLRYAPNLTDDECKEAIKVYREQWAPQVPKLWQELEYAAVDTVWEGKSHEAFGVEYRLEDGWLTCRLPSGRKLWYWNPKPIQKPLPWDDKKFQKTFTYQSYKAGRMKTVDAYGGLLTENVVQATARDLLFHSMTLCEKEGLPIVLTVHDEIVAEPEAWCADAEMLRQIMEDRPQWAIEAKIPVAAETWVGPRYRK